MNESIALIAVVVGHGRTMSLRAALLLDQALAVQGLLPLTAQVHKCAQEVRQRHEQENKVSKAAVKRHFVGDGELGQVAVASDLESDEDDDHADYVLNRESYGQAGDAEPLNGVDLVAEAHVQVDPVEVAHQLADTPHDDPNDYPIVL